MKIDYHHVFCDIEAALVRERQTLPGPYDALPALMGELGDLAQALLHLKYEASKGTTDTDIYYKAIQVAVTAIRLACEGDINSPYCPDAGYRNISRKGGN